MNGFRAAALNSGSSLTGWTNFGIGGGMGIGLPAPFDAVAGNRLIGPSGSHPLAAISMEELVQPMTNGVVGEFAINGPVRIGEAISGTLNVTAQRDISARSAMVRLIGVLITEQRRSKEERDSKGAVTRSEQWVQIGGDTFEELALQPAGTAASDDVRPAVHRRLQPSCATPRTCVGAHGQRDPGLGARG